MIQDYKNLKKHCNNEYSIKDKKFKIGDLSDSQLEVGMKILRNKVKPTIHELKQLNSISYVTKYRSGKALDRLQNDIVNRRIEKANQKADIITNWINKQMK